MSASFASVAQSLLAVIIIVGAVYKFFLADNSPTRKTVFINRELGIIGTVTGYNRARTNNIYLNHRDTPYNFSSFVNDQLAPDKGLGYYLETGDTVTKLPNADTLTLQRHGQASYWHFVPLTPTP
jgi:hypothetical protein